MKPFRPIAHADVRAEDVEHIRQAVLGVLTRSEDTRAGVAALIYELANSIRDHLPITHPAFDEMWALQEFVDGATAWEEVE